MHHTEIAPNKSVKGKGTHHMHHEEICRELKIRALKFSNFAPALELRTISRVNRDYYSVP